MKPITYEKTALRTLARLPSNTRKRIVSKIEAYAKNPSSQAANIKLLRGSDNLMRLRVGDWRIIMLDGTVLAVLKIGPRGSIYEA